MVVLGTEHFIQFLEWWFKRPISYCFWTSSPISPIFCMCDEMLHFVMRLNVCWWWVFWATIHYSESSIGIQHHQDDESLPSLNHHVQQESSSSWWISKNLPSPSMIRVLLSPITLHHIPWIMWCWIHINVGMINHEISAKCISFLHYRWRHLIIFSQFSAIYVLIHHQVWGVFISLLFDITIFVMKEI